MEEDWKLRKIARFLECSIDNRIVWASSPEGVSVLGPGSPTVPGLQDLYGILSFVLMLMEDEEKTVAEKSVVLINGDKLTQAEVMTVRVALAFLLSELTPRDALGADDNGRAMAEAYQDCARSVLGRLPERL